MRNAAVIGLALLAAASGAGCGAGRGRGSAPTPTRSQGAAPPAEPPGLSILRNDCLACHTEDLIRQQRLTKAQWAKVIDKMQKWGAPTEPENVGTLTGYLGAAFGREAGGFTPASVTAGEAAAIFLPLADGPFASGSRERGLELYQDECAACHGEDGRGTDLGVGLAGRRVLDRGSEFATTIRAGRARMPGFEQTTDSEIGNLLAYLRSVQR